ncbi:MAG: flagellin lysine-N-methylase [Acutalibacteraceae bacterium]
MKDFAPHYYDRFHCIASDCRHNCCIGWEVDIDPETLKKYKELGGSLGEKIHESISEEDGVSFFSMKENGRCPFLCENNLCEIIKNLGEENLCDICREHPRFYNFFSERTEWGLGLCCEEAARIILSDADPFSLTLRSDDGAGGEEDSFGEYIIFIRDECIKIIEESSVPLSKKLETMLSFCEAEKPDFSGNELYALLTSLEKLEESRDERLEKLRGVDDFSVIDDKRYALWFENLTKYFIYRHISGAYLDMRISERACFVYLSVIASAMLCQKIFEEKGALTLYDVADISRAFSAETEYSEENTERILEYFKSL